MMDKVATAGFVSSPGQNTKIVAQWSPPGLPSGTIIHNWAIAPDPSTNRALILDNLFSAGNVTAFNSPPGGPHLVSAGKIAMEYQDDALIYYAKLSLTCGHVVGGTVELLTNTDSADSATDVSVSSIAGDYASPVVAAIAAAFVALMAGGGYVRRRWLS